jgi:hypothetical protein
MLRFPVWPDALPLNLIWNFETTSSQKDYQGAFNGNGYRVFKRVESA